ncbi:MAG: hypothetical protein IJT18_02165, partial [Oscillospiraceae bacterium]|nr:hypothetical protein [Oscillospiraceae bacterium]
GQTEPVSDGAVGEAFAAVTPENVPALVKSMARPARYHQTLTVEVFSGDDVGTQTVELWEADGVRKIRTAEGDRVRHILTNGETAWLWYGDDTRNVREIALPGDVTVDDLSGIPTYETLAQLPPDAFTEARYEAPETPDGAPCLYVETAGETAARHWVDLSTGLLRQTELRRGDTLILRLRQTELELPDADDAALARAMRLPDGQTVTAAEETPRSQ